MKYFLPLKESAGRLVGRCAHRDSKCAQRQRFRTATSHPPHSQHKWHHATPAEAVGHTWLSGYRLEGAASLALQWQRPAIWSGAPRSMPNSSFLARAASALLARAHVASRLSILCSSRFSTNSPSGVCRRHDRTELSLFSRSRRRQGQGGARGAGAGHSRRGCVPASPIVGVRRQPPAGYLLTRQVERTTNRTSARRWCAYRAIRDV